MERYQEQAMIKAMAQRREDLRPLREEIAQKIERLRQLGFRWRAIRGVIDEYLPGQYSAITERGSWWSAVGKRNGAKILAALDTLTQLPPSDQLFDPRDLY